MKTYVAYWAFLLCLTVSCIAVTKHELNPGEEIDVYRCKVPGLTVAGKTIGGLYEPVRVIAAEDPMQENVIRRQEKALGRVDWGIGLLVFGTVVAALLKSYELEFFGVIIGFTGGGMVLQGMALAKVMEHWDWVLPILGIITCAAVIYLFHGKGIRFRSVLAKIRGRAKL